MSFTTQAQRDLEHAARWPARGCLAEIADATRDARLNFSKRYEETAAGRTFTIALSVCAPLRDEAVVFLKAVRTSVKSHDISEEDLLYQNTVKIPHLAAQLYAARQTPGAAVTAWQPILGIDSSRQAFSIPPVIQDLPHVWAHDRIQRVFARFDKHRPVGVYVQPQLDQLMVTKIEPAHRFERETTMDERSFAEFVGRNASGSRHERDAAELYSTSLQVLCANLPRYMQEARTEFLEASAKYHYTKLDRVLG